MPLVTGHTPDILTRVKFTALGLLIALCIQGRPDGLYLSTQAGVSGGRMASDSRPPTISTPDNLPSRSTHSATERLALGYDWRDWSFEVGAGKLDRYSETRNWQAFDGGRYNAHDDFQDIVVSTIEADVRVERHFRLTDRLNVYPLAGLALVHWQRELDNCIPSCQNVQTVPS